MEIETNDVDIFQFSDYRLFLGAALSERIQTRDLSYRYFARKAGFASPNYLQRVIKGERSLTQSKAQAVGEALMLDTHELKYFLGLVALDQAPVESKSQIQEQLARIAGLATSEARADETIHSSWLHGVIWCLAGCDGFEPDSNKLAIRLRGIATPDQVEASLSFLLKKGYISSSPEKPAQYEQRNIRFKVHNDERRMLDLQQTHIRFLDLAKQRLVEDLSEREFQGLTIAIPDNKFSEVKTKIRDFFTTLSDSLAFSSGSDTIVRIQCAAYKITRPKDSR